MPQALRIRANLPQNWHPRLWISSGFAVLVLCVLCVLRGGYHPMQQVSVRVAATSAKARCWC